MILLLPRSHNSCPFAKFQVIVYDIKMELRSVLRKFFLRCGTVAGFSVPEGKSTTN